MPPPLFLPKIGFANPRQIFPTTSRHGSTITGQPLAGDVFPAGPLVSPNIPQIPNIPTVDNYGIGASLEPNAFPQAVHDPLKPQFQNIVLGPTPAISPQQNAMAALNEALNHRAAQGRADVGTAIQGQIENGQRGYQPLLNPEAADARIIERLPQNQLDLLPGKDVLPESARQLPGIGTAIQFPNKDRVVVGRYGTGTATETPPNKADRSITENGKKVPIASWFKDAARSQGESNNFFNKEGRKIVPDKAA